MPKQQQTDRSRKAKWSVTRRKFLQGVMMASATTGAYALPTKTKEPVPETAKPVADQWAVEREGDSLKVLTPEQYSLLTAVLNHLVPASDSLPAAGDVQVAKFIDGVLVEAPHLRRHIMGLLGELERHETFTQLPPADADGLLERLQEREKDSFDVLLQCTYTGYYGDPQILAALGWRFPDEAHAHAEYFDASVLNNVRTRGPIYRHV